MTLIELLQIQALTDPNDPKKVQHLQFAGFGVTIEFPKGSIRTIKNTDGDICYKKLMQYPYGFLDGTEGRDGDEVDIILGPNENAEQAFVAHMIDKGPDVDQREDEDKAFLGFDNYADALSAFYSMYPKNFFGGMTVLPIKVFKQKLQQTKSSPDKMLHAAQHNLARSH
jgi:hypothetical protein